MEVWAATTWATIHDYSTRYKGDSEKAKRFYTLTLKLLCCLECRKHAPKELVKFPLEKYLKNNETLFTWTWTLHDSVNARIKHSNSVLAPGAFPLVILVAIFQIIVSCVFLSLVVCFCR